MHACVTVCAIASRGSGTTHCCTCPPTWGPPRTLGHPRVLGGSLGIPPPRTWEVPRALCVPGESPPMNSFQTSPASTQNPPPLPQGTHWDPRSGDLLNGAAWWTPPGNCTKVLFLSFKSRPPYLHSHCCDPGRETLRLAMGPAQWCRLVDTLGAASKSFSFFQTSDIQTSPPTAVTRAGTPCCQPRTPRDSGLSGAAQK